MKKVRRIISASVCMLLIIIQTVTVSALYKKAYECSKDELFDEAWSYYEQRNIKYSESVMPEPIAFEASMARYELKLYLEDYEPLNKDVTVSDVANEFSEYLEEKYNDITFDIDENDNIYEINSDGNKYSWTYNESLDQFECKDSSEKLIKSYNRYHPENETTVPTNTTSVSEENSQADIQYEEAKPVQNSETDNSSSDGGTVVSSQSDEEETPSGMNATQIIILCVVGAGIIIVVCGIVYTIHKNKKNHSKGGKNL